MTEPTKQLTNREYLEYLTLKDKASNKKPSRIAWLLAGMLLGILLTVVCSAILARMNLIWFIH